MNYWLIGILAAAFIIRFWGIGNADILGDEAAQAFRSIGYLDYFGSSFQTQPVDWFKDRVLPKWTSLSFHDDPPLFFIIQHLFFNVFGDTPLTARLPGIFAGTFSTWLIYLISGLALRPNENWTLENLRQADGISLLAAAIFAIEPATVGIFRTSLIEPVLIFFILLNFYWFLRFLDDRKEWLMFGITFGAVALTKYTGIFLLPAYFVYLLIFDRDILKKWHFYASLLITLLMFTPVLVYNFYLYRTVGHFDLQFAYLLGQETPEWTGLIGKEQAPFSEILGNLGKSYGWPMLILALFGGLNSIWLYRGNRRKMALIWLYFAFLALLLMAIGSAVRFLSLLSPVIAVLSSVGLWTLWSFRPGSLANYASKSLVILSFGYLLFFAVEKNIVGFPSYGINALDDYFMEEFKGVESAVIPESDNRHLNNLILSFAEEKSDKPRAKILIVYNDNVALPTLEWIFYRRFFYHSIPTLFVENFQKVLVSAGPDYFRGFTVYFVQSTENTPLNPFKADKIAGAEFENLVLAQGVKIDRSITETGGKEMFRIYKWEM